MEGILVNLYTTNKEEQYSYIEAAKAKGYSVIDASGQLDVPTLSMLEQKQDKTRYVRVDSDIVERIIQKEDTPKNNLSEEETDICQRLSALKSLLSIRLSLLLMFSLLVKLHNLYWLLKMSICVV